MNTQIKIFNCTQSYSRDFSKFEVTVNRWIAGMEKDGGKVIDVRVQAEGLGDKFVWVMYSVTVIYFYPGTNGEIEAS